MQEQKNKLVIGALICTLGYFFIAAMGACSKLLPSSISVFEILFIQNLICLILTLPQVFHHGIHSLQTKRYVLHIIRDVMGLLSFFSLFFALKSIPLVDGMLLQNAAPLWIPFVILIWSRVAMRGPLWWGMILGFVGIILILKPGAGVLKMASLWGVASGIFLAVALVAIRKLTTTEPTHRILFFYFLLGTIVTAPFVFEKMHLPSLKDALFLLGVGVFMYLGQILITYSFKFGKASTFAPIAYSTVIFSGIIGWLIWGHIPDLLSLFGMLLVIIGGVLSLYFEKKFSEKPK